MNNLEQKPVVLINGYNEIPSPLRVGYKPDINSRLQVLAATELLRRHEISKVVIVTGDVPSTSNSGKDVRGGIGARMAEQLRRNLPDLPESTIVFHPVAKSTRKEVREFRKLATDEGWTNLMVIGKKSHLERIQRAVNRFFRQRSSSIPVISQESVLARFPRYAEILDTIRSSEEEKAFSDREISINAWDKLPIVGGTILDLGSSMDKIKIAESWLYRTLLRRTESSRKTN